MSFRHIYLRFSGLLLPYIWKDWNIYNVSKYVLLNSLEITFVNSDTLGRRISFLKVKLSEWCHQAYLIKKAKTIRRDNVLCCRGNDLITVTGDLKKPYKQKKKKFNKRFYKRYDQKRYFIIRKAKYFRKNWNTNRRMIYRNNPKKAKECRCYACDQIGHYANECPNKFNKKNIELDPDTENMIQ